MNKVKPKIFTIGHSTHPIGEFLKMLHSFQIQTLADVRSLPGSNKFPQFNKENLEITLQNENIHYLHLKNLGGRRKVHKDSHNTRWHNASFRSYADYMETEDFATAVKELDQIALESNTAIMCAEAVWWRCHRSMISDFLKVNGWGVFHIMSAGVFKEHEYTSSSVIENGLLYYCDR